MSTTPTLRSRPRHARPAWSAPRIVVLIPAHDEEDRLPAAIAALHAQTRRPDTVTVIADNCTDRTARVAADAGALVLLTSGNTDKKAGALNQGLNFLMPTLREHDLVLVQDADTVIGPEFLAHASTALHGRAGAVGGIFYGDTGGGLLGTLQRIEFHRYAREISRRKYRADVLTGTATLFRVATLQHLKEARRDGRLPGGDSYYCPASLTEDDEITKAVRTLGYRTLSPAGCAVTTEVMPSLGKLWHQRVRWQRGALENLRLYGLTPVTWPYFLRQIAMGLSVLALLLYLVFTVWMVIRGVPAISPLWVAVGTLFIAEKIVTARGAGIRCQLLAATLVVELVYDLFQHAVYLRCLYDFTRRRQERWLIT
ncbi:glycosyltransferase family 2 protein [Streptomyces longisporoflavus]|uniref:Glycosyltransferase family 2 protein n=1 Tax=Streptomyces longisporoflavus TaxID=28044 RepID=A0ABW7R0H2_9ACTN